MKCRYRSRYYNYSKKSEDWFQCQETEISKSGLGLCIFHDKRYLRGDNQFFDRKNKIIRLITQKIKNCKQEQEELHCIGYYISDIHLDGEFTNNIYFNKSKFLGKIIIDNCIFKAAVSFTDSEFYEKNTVLNNAKFNNVNGDILFDGTKFLNKEGEIQFNYCEFNARDSINFTNSVFRRKKILFNRVKFTSGRDIIFTNAKFIGIDEVKFSHCEFNAKGTIVFNDTKFYGNKIYFNGTKFTSKNNLILFKFAKFIGIDEVKFFHCEFNAKRTIEFTKSQFYGNQLLFKESNFISKDENILFDKAKLKSTEQILFFITNFNAKRTIMFTETKFYGKELLFDGARFQSIDVDILFDDTRLIGVDRIKISFTEFIAKGGVVFYECIFLGKNILFRHVKFQSIDKDIIFDKAKFLNNEGDIKFEYSEFYSGRFVQFDKQMKVICDNIIFENTKFSNVRFDNEFVCDVYFEKSQFLSEAYFSAHTFKNYTYFDSVEFGISNKIYFLGNDLSKISFLKSDVTRIRFTDNAEFCNDKNKYKTFDEKRLEYNFKEYYNSKLKPKLAEINLGDLLTLYRDLRENYEYNLRYEVAGEFFIREMELKRNYKTEGKKIQKKSFRERNLSLLALYRLLAKYGESYKRPLFLIFFIFIVAFVWWSSQSSPTINEIVFTTDGFTKFDNATHIIKSNMERSLLDVTPLITLSDKTLLDIIFKSISAVGFGLLFISLRRKFERRFRH